MFNSRKNNSMGKKGENPLTDVVNVKLKGYKKGEVVKMTSSTAKALVSSGVVTFKDAKK